MFIATLRRFNRTYTQRIGVLEESFLGTGRPLAVSRLLWEIGTHDGITVRSLRERLDLDSGHLSRLLRQLEADGLTATSPDPADGRRRVARLTAAGHAAYADLEERSEAKAAALIEPLTPRQQQRLGDALTTADLLIRAATVQLRTVTPDEPTAVAATAQYFAELDARFTDGFDPGPPATEPGSTYVVASSDGEPIAYGGIRPVLDDETAEIKRMWVHDGWRGAGLGARMLRHLEQLAAQQGFVRIVLDTNGSLREAIAMYERAGYARIERYNDNPYAEAFFEKRLI